MYKAGLIYQRRLQNITLGIRSQAERVRTLGNNKCILIARNDKTILVWATLTSNMDARNIRYIRDEMLVFYHF